MQKISSEQIEQIQALRQTGSSVPEISKIVKFSKTTVLRYINGVEILPEFLPIWIRKRGGSTNRMRKREKMALVEAKKIVGSLTKKEKLLFISALYWAEGNKKDFILTNTDPKLIKVFTDGIQEIFGIEKNRLQISIRLYQDLNRKQCLNFWSKVVNIPVSKFISVHILEGKKKGKLEFGMCRVRVSKGGDLLKKIKAINSLVVSDAPVAQ